MTIKIEVTENYNNSVTRIVGYINGRDIVSVSNQIFGKWHVGSSTCLPSDFEDSNEYIECMRLVFEEAKNHGA